MNPVTRIDRHQQEGPPSIAFRINRTGAEVRIHPKADQWELWLHFSTEALAPEFLGSMNAQDLAENAAHATALSFAAALPEPSCGFCGKPADVTIGGNHLCRYCAPGVKVRSADIPNDTGQVLGEATPRQFSPQKYFAYEWPSILDGFWNWQKVQLWRGIVKESRRGEG